MSYQDPNPAEPPEDRPPPPGGPPPGTPPPGAQQPDYAPPGYQQPGSYPAAGGYPPGYQPVGVVPPSLDGVAYNKGLVILLTIITCGLFGIYWTYRTNEDLKAYNGDGLGGGLGIVIFLLLSVVLMFTIPAEVEKMYQRDGRESPVSPMLGLWFLLPIIGNIIWYLKVQDALNDFWLSKGAQPAG
jgi:Domain of unknown function (DUF4234)